MTKNQLHTPHSTLHTSLNGWLFIDKPLGLTSVQLMGKVRRIIKGDKAGHAGTLDPLASGVLPLAFGEATKLIPCVVGGDKEYVFTVEWGKETDTFDSEGKVTEVSDVMPAKEDIEKIILSFIGRIRQKPPKFSAIKIDGQRAYDMARAGKEPEMPVREVMIYELHLKESKENNATFFVRCSKGTYIRSLAVDIARALGTRGFVAELRRIRVGKISVEDSVSLEALEEAADSGKLDSVLHPLDDRLLDIDSFNVTQHEAGLLKRGVSILIRRHHLVSEGTNMLAQFNNKPVAVVTGERGHWKIVRGLNIV
ncbi:MAG: tRNA pseudouridine(55) synthase TruB [Alphaproteobacteria bacterium]|nr:tRNA pseudouridine(55) synthase TruB [Alphaproteobacteria bacterium]